MLLCDGLNSSVSSVATRAGASFSWECAWHSDSFGSKLNSLQSQVGQERSYPYGKAVLAAKASSPTVLAARASSPTKPCTAVQCFDDMKSLMVQQLISHDREKSYHTTIDFS